MKNNFYILTLMIQTRVSIPLIYPVDKNVNNFSSNAVHARVVIFFNNYPQSLISPLEIETMMNILFPLFIVVITFFQIFPHFTCFENYLIINN